MGPPTISFRDVAKFRGMLFVHSLVELADCPRSARGLSRWGQEWTRRHRGDGTPLRNRKWGCYLEGALPNKFWCSLLTTDYPDLRGVLENPLWQVLRLLASGKETDALVLRIRVNDDPLGPFSKKSISLLLGTPGWERLWVALALYGTTDIRWLLYRKWLERNLSTYIKIASLRTPLCFAREQIFSLCDQLFHSGSFSSPCRWPGSWDDFRGSQVHLLMVAEQVERNKWAQGQEKQCQMLWQLTKPGLEQILSALLSHDDDGGRLKCPDRLRMRVKRALEGSDHLVTIE